MLTRDSAGMGQIENSESFIGARLRVRFSAARGTGQFRRVNRSQLGWIGHIKRRAGEVVGLSERGACSSGVLLTLAFGTVAGV